MEAVVSTTEVIDWAKQFLAKADQELTPEELKEQKKFASLVQTPEYKTFLSRMLDESSQIRDNGKLNKRVRQLIQEYGIPDFFTPFDQLLIRAYMLGGFLFPAIAMPIFKSKLRKETNKIIISEERPKLTKHLAGRWNSQIGQNVNLLGEVVLGDKEAEHRYLHYLEALKEPDINYISIKLSGIYAQIHALSYAQNKKELCDLVAAVYREAIANPYIDASGKSVPKFVNLDMEEYKDAELTLDVFIEVLSRPEFKHYKAGIVVQAYLPDASSFQDRLLAFAKKRVADGGSPIKMRLVKGANLQMESIVSSMRGWANPVQRSKVEVDANYMHILDKALLPENAPVVNVGVASHNYFTIAYAHLLAEKNHVTEYVTFEMLEGMANNLPRVMRKLEKQIILYTPVVKSNHFLNAISYLVRRLDENTGKENFLSYTFNLKLDSPQWNFLAQQFLEAHQLKDTVNTKAYRTQDRTKKPIAQDTATKVFVNEPDTDLDLAPNRQWALDVLKKWEEKVIDRAAHLATPEQVKAAIEAAEKDASGWRKTTVEARKKLLFQVAENLSAKRGDLIGVMAATTGKTFTEGDVEVSEAIDFARFYPISMQEIDALDTVTHTPKGIVLVIPPWNFPLAIPVGGVVAALAGGNTVILKPATVALPIAWEFVQCFWDAGIPKDALQLVCPADRAALHELTAHPSIKHIILTGGTDTAFRLLENSPRTPLSAETGGKNAIIVTANADQDHAILNIVSSAFSNAGQKCSACSLLLLDKKAFNDETFKTKLKDAVQSMRTGSPWDTMNVVGPMIDNKNEKLHHAIEHLDAGEEWLVAPEFADKEQYILKPTVKWGVKPGSYTFKNELFAPLLSVVCIDDLEQGIKYANSSDYGLTAGLQSLNEAEQTLWKNSIEAGNLYINRGITGAIVRRQPFGGMKRSAFGGGIKAGGPNYVTCFLEFTEKGDVKDRVKAAEKSYQAAWENIFSKEEDVSNIYGEENIFRYLPLRSMALRVQTGDSLEDIQLVLLAAQTAKTPLTVSLSPDNPEQAAIEKLIADQSVAKHGSTSRITLSRQDEADFLKEMNNYERIRTVSPDLSDAFYKQAAKSGKHIANAKPLIEGRLELLHYLKEQSIASEYHRYGSIFGEDK
ncbi:MAG: bifunctional proline dehydrogenase/L-glutamate gamma-semialdehyde dehydrogenase [Candidatus Symbiothrix sp.]|jgi:RHH-type proline utilization regulon transcriptional repressor/proline dehydrogenase/delta 1-pyrroline-5-carboxylate dehydrogenase|nr:bifunctional proline dehydrogenase/L-glutamate gamma-semialdehyde dehydrogenase [Candidatus Symbiothrix sp.]